MPDASIERLTVTRSGDYAPATAGSSSPVQVVSHAGIVQTCIYELTMPPGAQRPK